MKNNIMRRAGLLFTGSVLAMGMGSALAEEVAESVDSGFEFYQVPFTGSVGHRIDVANNGTLAFSSEGSGLYTWSPSAGLLQLAPAVEGGILGTESPAISSDGSYVAFHDRNPGNPGQKIYAFKDGEALDIPERPLKRVNNSRLTGLLASDTYVTGRNGKNEPAVYNIETGETISIYGEDEAFDPALEKAVVFEYFAETGIAYLRKKIAKGEFAAYIRYADGNMVQIPQVFKGYELPVVSDKGNVFAIYNKNDAENPSVYDCQLTDTCTQIIDANTLEIIQEIDFRVKDVSADGSVLVGYETRKEPAIWDAENGVRNIKDMLGEMGVDTTDLNFRDLKLRHPTLAVSPNGTKIAGTIVGPDDLRTPFLFDLDPACTATQEECEGIFKAEVMVGAFIDGNSWNSENIAEFNVESNLDLAFVNFFASMSGRFDWHHREQMNKIVAQGAMPMMSFEPKFWDGSVTGQDEIDILQNIAAGAYDENFRKWINGYGESWEIGFRQWIQAQPEGSTIMYRFAHEMNGGWYPWGLQPEAYVAAWQHLHALFEEEGVNQYIQWVWCPNETSGDAVDYYPGDEYVDWTCIDTYNWGSTYSWSSWRSFKDSMMPSYNFLVTFYPNKPIVVGEFGSYEPADLPGENDGDNADAAEDKNLWKEEMARDLEMEFPAVRAISIFNLGTFRMYGDTFQGNPATGIDGWNLGLDESYFTSDYLSVK